MPISTFYSKQLQGRLYNIEQGHSAVFSISRQLGQLNRVVSLMLQKGQLTPQTDSMVSYSRASGKIMLAGGYSILLHNHQAVMLTTEASFFCKGTLKIAEPTQEGSIVLVRSPQIHSAWKYQWINKQLKAIDSTSSNPFVQQALFQTLRYYAPTNPINLQLVLCFDKQFFSNKVIEQYSSMRFAPYDRSALPLTKTGLGSSACVVGCIVSGVIRLLTNCHKCHNLNDPFTGSHNTTVNLITTVNHNTTVSQNSHNHQISSNPSLLYLSMLAHSAAQSRMGSNADVSAALCGSQLYRNTLSIAVSKQLNKYDRIDKVDLIKMEAESYSSIMIPKCQGYLFDYNRGEDTRVMVRRFRELVTDQDQYHHQMAGIVQQLYQRMTNLISRIDQSHSQLVVQQQVNSLKDLNRRHRTLLQKYTQRTGIPLEPKQFTPMMDQLTSTANSQSIKKQSENNKSLYVICPGSGGYDAFFCLKLGAETKQAQSEDTIKTHVQQFTIRTVRLRQARKNTKNLFNQLSQLIKQYPFAYDVNQQEITQINSLIALKL